MADVTIKQLVNKNNGQDEPVYPLTHEKAVVLTDGTRLDALLAEILRRLTALESKELSMQGEVSQNTKDIQIDVKTGTIKVVKK